MKKVGEVVLILNDRVAVMKTTQPVILGSEVSAIKEVQLAGDQQSRVGVSSLQLSKGKLKVLQMQGEGLYLISTISKATMTANEENVALAESLKLYKQIFNKEDKKKDEGKEGANAQTSKQPEQQTANTSQKPVEDVKVQNDKAEYSARLNEKEAMNVDFSLPVKVGDAIFF